MSTCKICGATISLSAGFVEDTAEGGALCAACRERLNAPVSSRHNNDNGVRPFIWGYHCFAGYQPRLMDGEKDGKTLLYGVELEFGESSDTRTGIDMGSSFLGPDWHYENDGSLGNVNGQEFITMPCSLAYHQQKFGWPDICNKLLNAGFRSHDLGDNECGLHVHITRALLSDLTIMKIDSFMNKQAEKWRKIARRNNSYWGGLSQSKSRSSSVADAVAKKKGTDLDLSRYVGVNLTNNKTVEIRIARGTLVASTVLGTVELYDAMIQFLRQSSIEVATSGSQQAWDQFVAFVNGDKTYRNGAALISRFVR